MSAKLNWSLVRRILAGVLLGIILGTAAHRHGNVTPALAFQSAIEAPDSGSNSAAGTQSDCSICKLHNQLSTSLIDKAPPVELPLMKVAPAVAKAVGYQGPAALSARGRAPPLTSPV